MKTKITQAQAEEILMDSLTEMDFGDTIYETARNIFHGFIDFIEDHYDIEGFEHNSLNHEDVAWYDDIDDEFMQTAYDEMTNFLTSGKRFDLNTLRDEYIGRIKAVLFKCGIKELNINDLETGDNPMVHWGYEEEDTFTLDSIRIKSGHVYFDSSADIASETDSEETIPTDALVEIAEFLVDHEDDIKELAGTD